MDQDICGEPHPDIEMAKCNKQPHDYGGHVWDNGYDGLIRHYECWAGNDFPIPTTPVTAKRMADKRMQAIAYRALKRKQATG